MSVKRVSPEEVRRLVEEEDYLLLDVRSVPEFEEERPVGAYNVPFLHKQPEGMVPNAEFESVVEAVIPDKAKGIATMCRSGGRSLRSARRLEELGYTQVVDMRGGFSSETDDAGSVINEGWKDADLPVEAGTDSPRAYAILSASVAGAAPEAPNSEVPVGDGVNRFASAKRVVHCVKFDRDLPGLKRRPYPGSLGQRLFESVSALAWNDWVEHSKMIINEYRVVSTDPKAMQMLYEECERFFFGDGASRPTDYVPPA